jgi:lambda family phage tail tape measure protein
MAIAKFTIEMAADLGQLRRDVQNINQVVSQMGGQIAQHYKPGIDALNAVGAAHNKVADQARMSAMAQQKSSRQVQQQNIQLANQLQDFAIQVAGGQNPLLAFAQQGSQLFAVYGGLGNAVRAVTALITPMSVAITGGAAVVGVLGKAWLDASRDAAEFRKGIALTGNAVGMTADRFEESINRINEQTGLGAGYVREMAQALVSTGRFGPYGFEDIAKTASLMAQITGKSAKDVAQEFASMADAPADYAAKANKSLHFLSDVELKYIEKLEANGQRQKAVQELMRAMSTRYSQGVASDLSWLDKQVVEHNRIWSNLWGTIKGMYAEDTIDQKIEKLESGLQHLNKLADFRGYGGTGDAGEAALESLKEQKRLQKMAADKKAGEAAAEAMATEKRRLDSRLKSGRESVAAALSELAAKRDIAKADEEIGRLQAEQARGMSDSPVMEAYYKEAIAKQELLKIDRQRVALQADLSRARASGGDKPEDQLAAQQRVAQVQGRLLDLDKQRSQVARQLGTDQFALSAKQLELDAAVLDKRQAAADSLGSYYSQMAQVRTELEYQAQMIGKTALETERLNFERQLDAKTTALQLEWTNKATEAGLSQLQIEQGLLALANEKALALQAYGQLHAEQYALIYDAERGASEAVKDYMQSISESGTNTRRAVGNVLSTMEDSLTSFVTKGKLDIKSFANTVISEFVRIKVAQPFVGALSGVVGGLFGGAAGGAAGGGAGAGSFNPLGGDFSGISEYSARGNAFTSKGVQAFARGGAFTNQVVTHPRRFAFAGGAAVGLMGEAGAEAVMPLQRDSRGRLGVTMSGGGGMPKVTVNVINQGGQGAEVTGQRTRQDSAGNMTVDVMVRQLEGALADNVAAGSGALYNAMGSRFAMQGAR